MAAETISSDRSKRLAAFYQAKGLARNDAGELVTVAEAKSSGAPTRKVTASPATATASGNDVQRAEIKARAAERKRWEAVMLSDGVKGRERIAAAMLASGDETAATILGKLGNIRTDAERQHAKAVEGQKQAAAVWERVIAGMTGKGART